MKIAILLYTLYSFFALRFCSGGSLGEYSGNLRQSVRSANDVNGQPEDAAIEQVEEEELPFQRVPVTLDLSNPNPELFEVEGEREGDGVYSGAISPGEDYYITRVMYGDEMLWISDNDWECTHAEIYTTKDKVLIMTEFTRGGEVDCEAIWRKGEEEWEEVDMVECTKRIIEIMTESPEMLYIFMERRRGLFGHLINYLLEHRPASDLENMDPTEIKRPYRLEELEKLRTQDASLMHIIKRDLGELLWQMGVMTLILSVDGISRLENFVRNGFSMLFESFFVVKRMIWG